MAITDAEAARQMAEQNPDLHKSRQIAFGQNYLQDLEEGKGTAQYYTGFGVAPDWVTGAIGDPYQPPAAQEPTPVVQDPTTMIPQTGGGGGAGITGASAVQPITDQAGAVAAMTPNQAYAIPGQMPKTPVSGVWGPMDYLQDETVTPPITDQAGAVAAMTQPAAYNVPGTMPKTPAEGMVWGPQEQFQPEISDPFLMSGAAGGARLPQIGFGEGKVDPALAQAAGLTTGYPEAAEQDPAWWESARNKFIETGQDVGGFFGDLKDKGIDVGKMAGSAIMNMVKPGLGLLAKAIPGETPEDAWNKQFAVEGRGYADIIAQDPELGTRLADYSKDLKSGNLTGQDPFGRNTVSLMGNYEKELAEDLQYTGTNQFNLDKKAFAQAYFNKKGIGKEPSAMTQAEAIAAMTGTPQAYSIPGQMPKTPAPGMEWGPFEYLQPEEPVTGPWDEGKWGPGPKIYQDRIMDIADERRALQEELEDYRDPIMDMVEPAMPENLGLEPLLPTDLASIERGRDLHGGMLPVDDTMPENLGLKPYESWMDYRDPIMDMVEPEIDEFEGIDIGPIGPPSEISGPQIEPDPISVPVPPFISGGDQKAEIDRGGFDPGGGFVDQGGAGEFGTGTSTSRISRTDADYGQFGRAQQRQAEETKGGGGGGGGGKIVCTMMNESYGFGSFRNKIWLKHSKDLAPEYQIGYHKIFLPLVRLSKTNKVLKKTLEHIAVHRTIDIRQEARGKVHLLGRIYRKILEPICYWVGKYAKR